MSVELFLRCDLPVPDWRRNVEWFQIPRSWNCFAHHEYLFKSPNLHDLASPSRVIMIDTDLVDQPNIWEKRMGTHNRQAGAYTTRYGESSYRRFTCAASTKC